MTAHFADHKSLAFAFADLVQAGFAEDHMSANFGVAPDASTIPAEHLRLLEWLRRLAAKMRAQAAAPRHTPHHVESESADLTFESGARADEATEIVARHGGFVVAA